DVAEIRFREMPWRESDVVSFRVPKIYETRKTKSSINTLIFDNIKKGKKLKVPLSDTKKRSLIWTPDASRATALIGNTPDAFGQTWHLPVDESNPTYKEFITLTSEVYGMILPIYWTTIALI